MTTTYISHDLDITTYITIYHIITTYRVSRKSNPQ